MTDDLTTAETPATSPRLVWFNDDDAYHSLEPTELEINWDPYNLTFSNDADVKVSNKKKEKNMGFLLDSNCVEMLR